MDMNEFISLRNEITAVQNHEQNTWIQMYVVFIALFALGIEVSHYLLLVTYVAIIPFQAVINYKRWSVSKISAYIRIFYENNCDNLNWESMHRYYDYEQYYTKMQKSMGNIIRRTSSVQLAFLATSFFLGISIYDAYIQTNIGLSCLNLALIIVSVCLFFDVVILNREYHKFSYKELEHIIGEYRECLNK